MKKINGASRVLLATLLCAAASATYAQAKASNEAGAESFPSRPIRIVVPFTPGAFNDTFARATGQHLSEALKQPVIIENRAGAGAVIGTDVVAKATPDGYTILQVPANHSINTTLHRKLPYHPAKDFTFLTLAATSPFVLVVNPNLPATSVKELIALAKANPGKYTYASTGSGGNAHLMGEMLKTMAKIDLLHVPYKGASPALTDVVGGQVDMIFMSYAGAASAVKSGRVRAIGVTSKERWSVLPDLPTIDESGVPGYEAIAWWGFAAPAGTPPAIARKLQNELNKVARSEPMRAQFEPEGLAMLGTTQEEFAKFVEADTQKWAKIIKESGIVSD
jgi:tripartite-type tricarboxylate transporter receptor subunit TctC